jgi:hypothetical protein
MDPGSAAHRFALRSVRGTHDKRNATTHKPARKRNANLGRFAPRGRRRIRNSINGIASEAKQSIFLTFFAARWIASLRSQ